MRHIQAVSPLMVAASGAGSTRQAPHRSTMQRFLMRTKVTMLFLMSLLVILRITLQLVTILISSMRTMTAHCRGCENMNTAPLVRSEAGEAAMLILELQTNVPEDLIIREKAPTRTFSWLKAPRGNFTFKTLC